MNVRILGVQSKNSLMYGQAQLLSANTLSNEDDPKSQVDEQTLFSTKEEGQTKGSVSIMSIRHLELVLILPIKFHPDFSTISVFHDFRFPRFLFPPSNPVSPRNRFKLKMVHLRHKIFLYIKFH